MLHDGRDGIARIADRIWYPVWDSGARLDHAVRTVPRARRVARSDLKVVLRLLHARHVAGDADLTTRLREDPADREQGAARGADPAPRRARLPARAGSEGVARRAAGRARHPGDRRGVGGARARAEGQGRLRADPGRAPRAPRGHRTPP